MSARTVLLVDQEFAAINKAPDPSELQDLALSLQAEGCLDPVRYWAIPKTPLSECPIIDGHTRYTLLTKGVDRSLALEHWGWKDEDIARLNRELRKIPFPVQGMEFPNRKAAMKWAINYQLGRRNCTHIQKACLRIKLYDEAIASVGDGKRVETAQNIAELTGVGVRQVYRDVRWGRAMDRLALKSPALRDAALNQQINREDAEVIADAPLEVIRSIEKGDNASWKGAAQAVAKEMRERKIRAENIHPVVHIKALMHLEKYAGKLTRAKSDALEACGGKKCSWAYQYHEEIREALNVIHDSVRAWQRAAEHKYD